MDRIIENRTHARAKGIFFSLLALSTGLVATACGNGATGGTMDGSTSTGNDFRRELPAPDEVARSSDFLAVAVKYVSYRDSNGAVVADEQSVRDMIASASKVWERCNIGLELATYEVVDPSAYGLAYNPGTYDEIDRARMEFEDDRHILIMGTGTWGRGRDLGSANCYSSFPGDAADGVICEKKSAVSATLMAHEVGHWFYLKHTGPDSNLMDPIIAPSDVTITDAQCERARRTIGESRRNSVL